MRLVAIAIVSLALAALGARLLGLARRSGEEPERWLGLAFASAGTSVWLLPLAASGALAPEPSRLLALAAQAGITGAVVGFALFVWRVFRPASRPAAVFAVGLIAANVAAGGAVVASGTPVPVGAVGLATILARCAVLLWMFFESSVHARRMRRRLRLGLADPVIANRFVLWSIWTGALALIPLFVLALRALGLLVAAAPGAPIPATLGAVLAALGAGGAAAAVAVWLAFFPPPSYARWLVAHAPTAR